MIFEQDLNRVINLNKAYLFMQAIFFFFWLKQGDDDDVVKLYDLTMLGKNDASSSVNPFKVPVATLLYKMAVNLIQEQVGSKFITCCYTLTPV